MRAAIFSSRRALDFHSGSGSSGEGGGGGGAIGPSGGGGVGGGYAPGGGGGLSLMIPPFHLSAGCSSYYVCAATTRVRTRQLGGPSGYRPPVVAREALTRRHGAA